jgi:4-amino-4-deoxy-L-arabinose transferase-like glycosyltransferase
LKLATRAVALVAGARLLLHLALANRYGYFRDELYFLDCGRHLDWGYVDHAPLIGLYARVALLLGGSLPVLRGIAGIAGAALVVVAALIARRLGGGAFAQTLAALAVAVAPIYLGISSLFTMNVFEPLFWMGAVLALLRALESDARRDWLTVGALLGLGLMNKHSTVFFAAALAAGLLLSQERRVVLRPGPWLAVAVAGLLVAPNLLWQAAHAFPTLEDLRNVARSGKNVVLGPVEFAAQQALLLHPALWPLWLLGLVSLLRSREVGRRALGLTCAVFFVLLFLLKAKNYYLAPIYPMLFAAGSLQAESWTAAPAGRFFRWAIVVFVLLAGAVIAPIVTQFGWPELVGDVARVYAALPAEERAAATIFANNYGEAGAINQLGAPFGLPKAISGHQTYFFWGPQGRRSDVIIVLQGDREDLESVCASVELAGEHFHPWGMAEENRPIFVCRGLHPPLEQLWPRLKHWN